MKVILVEYNEKLGDTGDIVDVKAGYANNYLFPNGLALLASKGNINQMKLVKKAEQKVEAKNVEEAQKQVAEIGEVTLTFVVKAGEEGKLYGSITNKDIADKIQEEKNIEVDRKKIALSEHLKEIGEYDVDLKLYKEVKAPIKVIVEPDQESKELIEAYNKEREKEEAEEKERLKVEEKIKKGKKKEEEKAEKAARDDQPKEPEKDKPKGKNK